MRLPPIEGANVHNRFRGVFSWWNGLIIKSRGSKNHATRPLLSVRLAPKKITLCTKTTSAQKNEIRLLNDP